MRGTNCKSSCSESKKAFNTTSKESENKSFLVKTEILGCYVKKRCMEQSPAIISSQNQNDKFIDKLQHFYLIMPSRKGCNGLSIQNR